jgi:hopanoid biosynthesis associated RND transporter like protein HpnN
MTPGKARDVLLFPMQRQMQALLVGLVRFVRHYPWLVVAATLVITSAALAYTLKHLTVNTSVMEMLSPDLPFLKHFKEIDKAFPQDYRTLVIVVDGDTPEQTESAAAALSAAVKQRPDLVKMVFHPEADPFFRRNGLLYLPAPELETLSTKLAEALPMLAALNADPSLRGLAGVLVLALSNLDKTGEATVPPPLDSALARIADTVDSVADGQVRPFSWRGMFLESGPAGSDGRRQLVLVEPALDFTSLEPAGPTVAFIRETVRQLALTPEHGVRVRLTGELMMLQEEFESVERSINMAHGLSLVMVLVLLITGLRSVRLVIATELTLIVGLVLTAFFATISVGELNLISVAFAVLFIGIGVDFGIHFALRYQEFLDRGVSQGLALEEAAAGAGGALLLSAITIAIGFLSFLPTDYPGLAELGIIAAGGMIIAFFTSVTVLPALITLLPGRPRQVEEETLWYERPLELAVERHPRWVAAAAGLIAILCLPALPYARFDDNALNLRDRATESVSTLIELLDDPRLGFFRAMVLVDSEAEAEELAAKLSQLPEVDSAVALKDMLPEGQAEKLAILETTSMLLTPLLAAPATTAAAPSDDDLRRALAKLQTAAAAAAATYGGDGTRRLVAALQRLQPTEANLAALQRALVGDLPDLVDRLIEGLDARPFTVDDLPPALLSRKRTADGRVLVEVLPKGDARDQDTRRRFAAAVRSVAPLATGEPVIATEGGRAVKNAFLHAGVISAVLIVGLLLWMLRSKRDTIIVMTPLVLAALLTVATTVVFDMPFDFANVIALPLLFGLGVASGIHMVVRTRIDPHLPLMETSTPRAVLFSALTNLASFGALAVSTHPGMATMGTLLTISILLTTVCTIVVLPSLRLVLHGEHIAPQRGDGA